MESKRYAVYKIGVRDGAYKLVEVCDNIEEARRLVRSIDVIEDPQIVYLGAEDRIEETVLFFD